MYVHWKWQRLEIYADLICNLLFLSALYDLVSCVSCFLVKNFTSGQISWPPETELTLDIDIGINLWLDDIPNMEKWNQMWLFLWISHLLSWLMVVPDYF